MSEAEDASNDVLDNGCGDHVRVDLRQNGTPLPHQLGRQDNLSLSRDLGEYAALAARTVLTTHH